MHQKFDFRSGAFSDAQMIGRTIGIEFSHSSEHVLVCRDRAEDAFYRLESWRELKLELNPEINLKDPGLVETALIAHKAAFNILPQIFDKNSLPAAAAGLCDWIRRVREASLDFDQTTKKLRESLSDPKRQRAFARALRKPELSTDELSAILNLRFDDAPWLDYAVRRRYADGNLDVELFSNVLVLHCWLRDFIKLPSETVGHLFDFRDEDVDADSKGLKKCLIEFFILQFGHQKAAIPALTDSCGVIVMRRLSPCHWKARERFGRSNGSGANESAEAFERQLSRPNQAGNAHQQVADPGDTPSNPIDEIALCKEICQVGANHERTMLQECAELIRGYSQAAAVQIWTWEPSRKKLVMKAISEMTSLFHLVEHLVNPAFRVRESILDNAFFVRSERARDARIVAFASVPIHTDEIYGVIVILSEKALPETLIGRLDWMGRPIGDAIERLRLEEKNLLAPSARHREYLAPPRRIGDDVGVWRHDGPEPRFELPAFNPRPVKRHSIPVEEIVSGLVVGDLFVADAETADEARRSELQLWAKLFAERFRWAQCHFSGKTDIDVSLTELGLDDALRVWLAGRPHDEATATTALVQGALRARCGSWIRAALKLGLIPVRYRRCLNDLEDRLMNECLRHSPEGWHDFGEAHPSKDDWLAKDDDFANLIYFSEVCGGAQCVKVALAKQFNTSSRLPTPVRRCIPDGDIQTCIRSAGIHFATSEMEQFAGHSVIPDTGKAAATCEFFACLFESSVGNFSADERNGFQSATHEERRSLQKFMRQYGAAEERPAQNEESGQAPAEKEPANQDDAQAADQEQAASAADQSICKTSFRPGQTPTTSGVRVGQWADPRSLAELNQIPLDERTVDALRNLLNRHAQKRGNKACRIENPDRGSRAPLWLYDEIAVAPIVKRFKERLNRRNRASGGASDEKNSR